jgi:hypothetical protein
LQRGVRASPSLTFIHTSGSTNQVSLLEAVHARDGNFS